MIISLMVFVFVFLVWALVLSSSGWVSRVDEQGFLFRPILGKETYYELSAFRLPAREERSGWRRILLPFSGKTFLRARRNICVFLRDADIDNKFLSLVSRGGSPGTAGPFAPNSSPSDASPV